MDIKCISWHGRHRWTQWTEPEEVEVTPGLANIINGEEANYSQTRICKTCLLSQIVIVEIIRTSEENE